MPGEGRVELGRVGTQLESVFDERMRRLGGEPRGRFVISRERVSCGEVPRHFASILYRIAFN